MDQYGEKVEQRTGPRIEAENSSAPRPLKVGDFKTILQLLLIAISGSTFIAIYILWIGISAHHKRTVDTAAIAALYAARQLSHVYVDSSSFGRVGLCDQVGEDAGTFAYSGPQASVTGLNTIYKTLELDAAIAKHLKRKFMSDLIKKDLEQAKNIENELTVRLHEAAEPDLMEAQTAEYSNPLYANSTTKQNNIYRDVYRMLAADKSSPDLSLIEVRLKLGRYKHALGKEHWPSSKIGLIEPPELFVPLKKGQAPYAVLVEAVFQTKAKNTSDPVKTVSKKYCALISAPVHAPARSALVLTFPNGLPPVFDSVMSVLESPALNGTGDWQQAVGNEVPGKGSLAPSLQPVLPGMSPADAFSVALYHWLKRQGPTVEEQRLYTLLEAKWNSAATATNYETEPNANAKDDTIPNSCLAIDTGARQYAILNQTGPGSIGQTALNKVFSIYNDGVSNLPAANFPQNAMPLFVDQNGKCNLSGRLGYDQQFVNDYLKAVYDTNLAAVETAAVSKMVIARASAALSQLDQKIFIERQELNSVLNRVNRAVREKAASKNNSSPDEVSRQTDLANEKIDALKSSIATHEEDRTNLRRTNQLAQITTTNANQVGVSTFELCTHAFKLCKEGVFRIDQPTKAFLISKKFVFTPCTKPVDESDFFKAETDVSEDSKIWLTKDFDVIKSVENARLNPETLIVEGHKYNEFAAAISVKQVATASAIFLTTDALVGTEAPKPLLSNTYPFDNIRIPSGQLFYYCKDAIRTGDAPKVSWSVVIRDLVASVGQNNFAQTTGNPIPSDHPDWCKVSNQHDCPGLACEFQLRTPLPVVSGSAETSLTNPVNNAQIQQIPPVPADML
jgi:hypothetical protein